MHESVTRYVKSCMVCARYKMGRERLQGDPDAPRSPIFGAVHYGSLRGPFQIGRSQSMAIHHLRPNVEVGRSKSLVPDVTARTAARRFIQEWVLSLRVLPRVVITDKK